ncbi:MAG: LPS export ABC transporter periplasmic protein LptC [Nitrospira sp.]|nr:LPS export ABC transporter periplasmic protein LptC [Nitrospira sp.]MCP9460948.1 LPS export ABC transporter periplasmic protein LptC [Nitrospira sp.]
MRRVLLAVSGALSVFLVYVLAMNAESVPPPGQKTMLNAMERADAAISEFVFTQSNKDDVEWKITAKQARLFEQEKQALLNDVDVTLYGENGRELTVSGEEGTFHIATKSFTLSNKETPLVVETRGGYTIYTNHVAWANDRKEVSTRDPIRIVGQGVEVTGRGFLGKLDVEEFEVLDDVRVALTPAS